jgi:hypothetical protein
MWLRCDVCRRFALLTLPPGYLHRDYRTVSFGCSVCGGIATHTITHPHSETGMGDYREEIRERPPRHPAADARLRGAETRGRADKFTPPSLRHKGQR